MKKRIVALLILATLMVGIFSTVAAASQSNDLMVGYAKTDINPYVYHYVDENREGEIPLEIFTDEDGREYYTNWNQDAKGNTTCELMPVPLRGFREPTERLCLPYKMDDNGDGLINQEDGIYATCIAMTDANGNTFITISIDMIGADESILVTQTQQAISKALPQVQQDHIMIAGTHTHGAADFSKISSLKKDTNLYIRQSDGKQFTGAQISKFLSTYRDNIVYALTQAAIKAVEDQEKAVISKGEIDTSEAKNSPEGDRMNVVRHYLMTRQKILKNADGSYVVDANGNYVVNPTGATVTYIAGDNFNGGGDPAGTKYGTYVVTSAQSVAESDDVLYALSFQFEGEKEPIVLINWRTHPCFNRNASQDEGKNGWPYSTSYYQTTSDYVNAFRKQMEKAGYRVSFHQGAGGNIDGTDPTKELNWLEKADPTATKRGAIYGQTLANIALELVTDTKLNDGKSMEQVEGGDIRVTHMVYQDEGNSDTPALQAAAQLYSETFTEPIPVEGEGYKVIDSNKNGLGDMGEKVIDTNTGATAAIASRYHAKAVISRMSSAAQSDAYGQVKIAAITIGQGIAFVSAPGELYDRYDSSGSVIDSATTGWKSLVSKDTYGTPFVLGYCNGTRGYFPNKAAYSYNKLNKDSNGDFSGDAVGSYEANTTRLAPGGGEAMIACFKQMLNTLVSYNQDNTLPAVCEHCNTVVTWSPLNMESFSTVTSFDSGHYYLQEDITSEVKTVSAGHKVCIYLNGHALTGTSRAITMDGGELSIIGDGTVTGTGETPVTSGGVISVASKAIMNMYGGTITGGSVTFRGGNVYNQGTFNMYGGVIAEGICKGASCGGNIYSTGTFNLYGGTIRDGQVVRNADGDTPTGGNAYIRGVMNMYGGSVKDGNAYWAAGNIYVDGELNMFGGTITGGGAEKVSKCVHVSADGWVTLSGDASIDQLRAAQAEFLTVKGKYTGKTTLAFASPPAFGARIGNSENAEFTTRNLVYSKGENRVIATGNSLYFGTTSVAMLSTSSTVYTYLQDAIDAADMSKNYVRLKKDTAEDIVITQNTVIDLYGYDLYGEIHTKNGAILWVMDSRTDDYSVSDGKYGYIYASVDGYMEPLNSVLSDKYNDYMLIETAEGVSVHRYQMQLKYVTLRSVNAGLYYSGVFYGDEVVQANVESFGIVLNAYEMPGTQNMETTSVYTVNSAADWQQGTVVSGAVLTDILKGTNTAQQNQENAERSVYGCAYMKTSAGYYISTGVKLSLRQVFEMADTSWSSLTSVQQAGLVEFYNEYKNLMKEWNIRNINSAS